MVSVTRGAPTSILTVALRAAVAVVVVVERVTAAQVVVISVKSLVGMVMVSVIKAARDLIPTAVNRIRVGRARLGSHSINH